MDIHEDSEPQHEVASPAGSIATPLDPQPGIEPAPRDWSLWLLPLGALMLLAGAGGIYYLPSNHDLLWPLCFWLALATAFLIVVAWRTIRILASPLKKAVRHTPSGKSITWNRFTSLSVLLLATILASALATVGMFAFAMSRKGFLLPYILGEIEGPFVLLVTSSVVIILLLFVWLVSIGPLQKLLQLRFAGLGILVVPVVIYLALNSSLPPLLDPLSVYTGPFASWPAMVQFAKQEADSIDKDAVVHDVNLNPYSEHGPYSPETTLFKVEFTFIRPNGEGIHIDFLDTNPIRIESVDSSTELPLYLPASTDDPKKYVDGFNYIKLGPREVYSRTEKEAIALAQPIGINIAEFSPSLHMEPHIGGPNQFGVPAFWVMSYFNLSSRLGIAKNGDSLPWFLSLFVDGTTGRALGYWLPSFGSGVMPMPQPLATASPSP